MSEFAAMEEGQAGLHRDVSSVTLTNDSTSSTRQPSRNSSTDSWQRKSMGSLEKMTKKVEASQMYFYHELDRSWMTVVLVICFFISGLIDSVAFNSWNCFVNMQSGNTIFAALGISGQPEASHRQQYYKSLTAIGAFCLGALFFSGLHRCHTGLSKPPSSIRRLNLIISFTVQTCFLVIAAALITTHQVSNLPFIAGSFSSGSRKNPPSMVNFLDLCPIALLSFQAAGQVTLSRLLGMSELPTIVVSTLYHDVCADLYNISESWRKSSSWWEFFTVHEQRQEKLALSIIALFLGGIVGGQMYKSAGGMAGAIWLAAGLKLITVAGFVFWRKDEEKQELPR